MSDELKPRSSIDSPEFRALVEMWAGKYHSAYLQVRKGHEQAYRALIAHIDAWGARMAGVPAGWKLMPEVPTNEIICAIERKVDDQLVASGMWAQDMCRQDGADIYEAALAAAPAPQADKEDGWKLAPVDSTARMDRIGREALRSCGNDQATEMDAALCWSAMIAVAPREGDV